jgi:putative membrane protein
MKREPLLGTVAGIVGGLVGSWAMVQFQHAMEKTSLFDAPEDEHRPHAERRDEAQPNEHDGTIPDEPATVRAASMVAEPLLGRGMSRQEKDVGGSIVHYAFGATVGAVYGCASEMYRDATRGFGLAYGCAVWLIADEIGLPLMGLSKGPTAYPIQRHAGALASHLVFGLTVECVRRAMTSRMAWSAGVMENVGRAMSARLPSASPAARS